MRKKIAVFVCAISFSNQKRVLEGILEEAKAKDIDVFIFTCHVNHSASYLKVKGAFSVMLLPDFSEFDGVVLMKNTIREPEVSDALVEKIRESKIPAVSIEEDIEGMHFVGISNYNAQKQVVEHFITKHGCRRICYVAGLLDNVEGRERFRAYLDAMKEYGLSVGQEDVYNGNYISASGQDAARYFLKSDKKLEAIIFANDAMAVGAINELQATGYRIPEDILIAGFDNDTFSEFSTPTLTTLDQNQEELGRCAVQLLMGSDIAEKENRQVDSRLVLRESCGCMDRTVFPVKKLRDTYGRQMSTISQEIDTMKNMSLELTGLDSMEVLYGRLKKYITASDMEAFFLCLEDEKSDQLDIPFAYRNGEFGKILPYRKGLVLPDHVRDTEEPAFYVASSIFYGDQNFGYIIQRGNRSVFESEFFYSWIVNVGVAIEHIQKIGLLQEMVDRLSTMWMYDSLTNLYNRGGFYHFAKPLLEHIQSKKGKCYLIFFDLDGLKSINDLKGHEAGDQYIVSMAEIIKRVTLSVKETQPLGMRYGGDEFVLFGECPEENELAQLLEMIRNEIDRNNLNNKDFILSCSMGVSIHDAVKIRDLDKLIEEADMKMYEEKKAKKRAGGQQR